jgi:hypothetical protein
MLAKIARAAAIAAVAGSLLAGTAFAASNPNGTGQPSQSCQSVFPGGVRLSPAGFNTAGFARAGAVYAGNGVSANHANSTNAVSQYDVACYQVSQH